MRLVLDTNILISAFFWDGNERKLLISCRRKKHQLIVSPNILDELSRVLQKKFKLPFDKINEYREEILLMAEIVIPTGEIELIKEDITDNIVLETAILGKADRIITGDKHLLKLKECKGIKITKVIK